MENKEVEKMLESIKCEYEVLEGKLHYQSKDVEKFLEDNQSLTKENAELKQQLQAKDKALDKACEKIAYDNGHRDDCTRGLECPATQYSFSPTICGEDSDCEDCCVKCWKEWAENGIDYN